MYTVEMVNNDAVYNDSTENISITLPISDFMGLIQIKEPSVLNWPEDYQAALKDPVGNASLNVLAKKARKVAIIVSDSTRGVPTAKILPFVLRELADGGVRQEQICIVVAIGVHRPATADEIAEIIGEEYVGKIKVINHDPYDNNQLVYIGKTSFGTPVEVNKTVYNADLRIAIGKVEPHEFAGFSGGRKSVLPGIASERTIMVNHRPEMLLERNARPGVTDGNPISDDMLEAAKMLDIHFIVNFVLNLQGDAVGIFSGDLVKAHIDAIEFMKSFCKVTLAESPDIVVTTPGQPLNIDFYQSIKPLIALAPIMKEDGVIVLYSACPDGFNSDDMLVPYEGTSNLEEVIRNLLDKYKIQMDHALLLCKILQQKIKVVAYSPNVEHDTLRKIHINPALDPQDALSKAYGLSGKPNPRVLFYPQPQRTLPVLG